MHGQRKFGRPLSHVREVRVRLTRKIPLTAPVLKQRSSVRGSLLHGID